MRIAFNTQMITAHFTTGWKYFHNSFRTMNFSIAAPGGLAKLFGVVPGCRVITYVSALQNLTFCSCPDTSTLMRHRAQRETTSVVQNEKNGILKSLYDLLLLLRGCRREKLGLYSSDVMISW